MTLYISHCDRRSFAPSRPPAVMVQITVPDWVVHRADERSKRTTIYSLSVHPDGTRLATGGLDTKIQIWATAPIQDEDVQAPRLLCTLARHTGAVLAVRWSHNGRYLASGSDDTVALIWELVETNTADAGTGTSTAMSTGFGSEANVEYWRPCRRLPGHTSDVTDVAWSETDAYLATVGLDSLVMIWSANDSFDRIRTIRGHHGFVKGVAFDPIDQFLATSSDDRTVKIWRTSDWGLEASVTEPFKGSPSSTFFHRLSWSPDGSHLLTANAMNGPVFVSSVIDRYTWASDIALVGHENAVSVAACSPQWFQGTPSPDAPPVTVVALGAQDQSLSVWMTGMPRPLLVARDLFERHVMDLQWSADGYTLYACSSDGSVAALAFTAEDLAPLVPDHVLTKARTKYGFMPSARTTTKRSPLPLAPAPVLSTLRPPPPPPLVTKISRDPSERLVQKITRAKNGKRRICPTPVGSNPDYALAQQTAPTVHGTTNNSLVSWPKPPSNTHALGPNGTSRPNSLLSPHTLDVSISHTDWAPRDVHVLSHLRVAACHGVVEVRNEADGAEVTWLAEERVQWRDCLYSPVLSTAVSERLIVFSLVDGSFLWYTCAGRRIATLMTPEPCTQLATQGAYVAAITRDGYICRWNAVTGAAHGQLVRLPRGDVSSFFVHTNGVPVAVFRGRQVALAWDERKKTFVCVAQGSLARLSAAWHVSVHDSHTMVQGPVVRVERMLNDVLTTPGESLASPDTASSATLRHLEMRLQAAELLDSPTEYRNALLALGRHLAEEGLWNQADDLLRMFLGPIYYRPNEPAWDSTVLGMSKRQLLSSLLVTMEHGKLDSLVQGVSEVLHALE